MKLSCTWCFFGLYSPVRKYVKFECKTICMFRDFAEKEWRNPENVLWKYSWHLKGTKYPIIPRKCKLTCSTKYNILLYKIQSKICIKNLLAFISKVQMSLKISLLKIRLIPPLPFKTMYVRVGRFFLFLENHMLHFKFHCGISTPWVKSKNQFFQI